MNKENHCEIYSLAKYYDIAFNRDIKSECNFLEEAFKKYSPELNSKNFVEFGAGPAYHSIEMARRGWRSTAVDVSPQMRDYGIEKAKKENVKINYLCEDMIDFKSNEKFDFAAILMDSTSYLLTNEDVINHLKCVGNCLVDNGLYILEMVHPKEVFHIAKLTENKWESKTEDCKVNIEWGLDSDVFDPISQITNVTVIINYIDSGKEGTIIETAPQRCFTATEFDARVKASDVFEIMNISGSMNSIVEFNNEKSSWRMVQILKKK